LERYFSESAQAVAVTFESDLSAGRAAEATRISPVVLSGIVRLSEALITAAVGFLVFYLYVREPVVLVMPRYALAVLVASQLQLAAFGALRLYGIQQYRRPFPLAGRMAMAWSLIFAALIVFAFLFKWSDAYSRGWLAIWFVAGFAGILLFRAGLAGLVTRWTREGRIERRVVIVGGDERAGQLIDALEADPDDIRIVGVFDDRKDRVPERLRGYPNLGTVKALVEFARLRRVDLLIVSVPMTAENRIAEMMRELYVLPVDIRLSAHAAGLRLAPHSYSYVGKVPMLDVIDRPLADWGQTLKAFEDRILAALFLLLALPFFAIIAAAIKLDSKGPVLFKQKRYGFNNDLVEVYKFRTLRTDMTDQNAERLVTAGDPRVTKVGKILRRTSIDEVPQLISVLKGNMSIVGPRPHATAAKAGNRLYQEVVDGYYARHRVKPGITGWAQINGWRGETDTEEKILRRTEHDLYYIDNWSLWFDLYIILRTPWALLKGENAY
jgi:Undecaprenyl-phosphate glucose phosphotransferase